MLNSKSTSRLLAVLCLNVKTMSEKCAIYDKIRGFQKYLVECEKSPNTIRCYLFAITNFLLSQKNDGEPDALSIVKWKQALMQQYSPATVNLRLSAMRSYCKYRGISCNIKLLKARGGGAMQPTGCGGCRQQSVFFRCWHCYPSLNRCAQGS